MLRLMEPVDWKVGEDIVVTSTRFGDHRSLSKTGWFSGYEFRNFPGPDEVSSDSERRTITAVSADGREVSVDRQFRKRHFAGEVDVGFNPRRFRFALSNGSTALMSALDISAGQYLSFPIDEHRRMFSFTYLPKANLAHE